MHEVHFVAVVIQFTQLESQVLHVLVALSPKKVSGHGSTQAFVGGQKNLLFPQKQKLLEKVNVGVLQVGQSVNELHAFFKV